MTAAARQFGTFDAAFAMAFEEEISGETFFAALAETEPDPRRAALWTKLALVENRTVSALRPLATKLCLVPEDENLVRQSGREEARDWHGLPFLAIMQIMDRDYPAYVTEFTNLRDSAPEVAKSAAQLLIDHEIAIIDMARVELSGTGDPSAPIDAYLDYLAGWTERARA